MRDVQRLSAAFVELADTLVTGFDHSVLMTTLASRCAEHLPGHDVGVVLAIGAGELGSVASSGEQARQLDRLVLQLHEGPCLDCFQSGQPLVNRTLPPADGRWPRFTVASLRAAFTMVNALPMRLRGEVIGAVSIYGSTSGRLSDTEVAVAQALADVATIGLLQERTICQARVLSDQLQHALTSRVVIEQAKGVLAERHSVVVDEAFERLRAHARSHNQRLRAVAEAVVDGSLPRSTFEQR